MIPERSGYDGFEQGPIRPPSEAHSLLIRVTRNCPWNRCTFCPVYKGARFSIRPLDHVKADVDAVHHHVETVRGMVDGSGRVSRAELDRLASDAEPGSRRALDAAWRWFANGMETVFLQDADSLIVRPLDLVEILEHLRARFPWVERVTSYARSHTLARLKEEDLEAMREAGLDRIHTGLESGSDQVLEMVQKGATKETHIEAGLKVKRVGLELSEYWMPGLGGRALSEEHALETADALNRIAPHFIRLRTLAIPRGAPLFEAYAAGRFEKCTDVEVMEEILTFLEELEGIRSVIKSDHILNLLGDLEGALPDDKDRLVGMVRAFLALDPDRQCLYQVGRRLGILSSLSHMQDPRRLKRTERAYRRLGITADNVDEVIDQLMTRFI